MNDSRQVYAVRISDDRGKTWRLVAICTQCIKEIAEPRQFKQEAKAGCRYCEWCRCTNYPPDLHIPAQPPAAPEKKKAPEGPPDLFSLLGD